MHRKYKLYIDPVTVAFFPQNYEQRLIEVFAGAYKNLRIRVLDPYDIALTKLGRDNQRDRDDIRFLARTIPFAIETLKARSPTRMTWNWLRKPGHKLARVKDLVESFLDQDLTLESLAREAGYSRAHFLRMFQESRDTTPHQYVMQRRIAHAEGLLSAPDRPEMIS